MALSSGIIGYGSLFQYDNTGYVTIGEVMDFTAPEVSCNVIDSTSNSTTPAGWREKNICGLADGGTCGLKIIYVETMYSTLLGFVRTKKTFKIVLTDGSSFAFDAWITKIGFDAPLDDKLTCDIELTLVSKPTFTVV